ncbi:MAG: lysylphosphatidylglycerol synthase transmembrane domain-containing protein [Myxococcaceae bacterium]
MRAATHATPMRHRHSGERRRTPWRLLSWLFGLSILGVVVIGAMQFGDTRYALSLALKVKARWLLLAVALQAGTYFCEAGLWLAVLKGAGKYVKWSTRLALAFAKLFVDQALPSAGWSGTMVLVAGLERRHIPRPTVMAGVVFELVSWWGGFIVALLGSLCFLAAEGTLKPAMLAVSAGLLVAAALVCGLLLFLVFKPAGPKLKKWKLLKTVLEAIGAADKKLLAKKWVSAAAMSLQVGIVVLDAATLWVCLHALGAEASPFATLAAFVIGSAARTLGVVPGGIGTFEGACVGTLSLFGVRVEAGLAATLLFRTLSFWLPLVPGLVISRREVKLGKRAGSRR